MNINDINDELIENCTKTIEAIKSWQDNLLSNLPNIEKIIKAYNEQISRISIPTLDERGKEKLKSIAVSWSNYGWTIGRVPIDMLKEPPHSFEEADAMMLSVVSNKDITNIFEQLKTKLAEYAMDIDDAQFAYNNKKYKLCCTVMFAIIDGYFSNRFLNKGKFIKEDQINKLLENNNNFEHMPFQWASNYNLLTTIIKFYHSRFGDDTNCETPYRNVLLHGQSRRPYDASDCLKLLLLLESATQIRGIVAHKIDTPKIKVELTPINY